MIFFSRLRCSELDTVAIVTILELTTGKLSKADTVQVLENNVRENIVNVC